MSFLINEYLICEYGYIVNTKTKQGCDNIHENTTIPTSSFVSMMENYYSQKAGEEGFKYPPNK